MNSVGCFIRWHVCILCFDELLTVWRFCYRHLWHSSLCFAFLMQRFFYSMNRIGHVHIFLAVVVDAIMIRFARCAWAGNFSSSIAFADRSGHYYTQFYDSDMQTWPGIWYNWLDQMGNFTETNSFGSHHSHLTTYRFSTSMMSRPFI